MATNNARKSAAKRYQAEHPGTTYPQALRMVSHGQRPLAAVIGVKPSNAESVWLNLEEVSLGGFGPHCGILGATGAGKTHLLTVMAHSIRSAAPPRGVQLVYIGPDDEIARFEDAQTRTQTELSGYLGSLCDGRQTQFNKLGQRDWQAAEHPQPAVVVMVDKPQLSSEDVDALNYGLRCGRSLDVHLVVAIPAPQTPTIADNFSRHFSSIIHLRGDRPGHATWQRYSDGEQVSTDIFVPAT